MKIIGKAGSHFIIQVDPYDLGKILGMSYNKRKELREGDTINVELVSEQLQATRKLKKELKETQRSLKRALEHVNEAIVNTKDFVEHKEDE